MPELKIKVAVIELTNKCDLKCIFCPEKEDVELDFKILEKLILDNSKLEKPIERVELGGLGNPLLHSKIKQIFELLHNNGIGYTVTTNGLNLREIISRIDNSLFKNSHFCIYLDHPEEKENDEIMGEGIFKKTIESIEYLVSKNLECDILMRVNSKNFDKIGEMLELSKHYNCKLLVPMETFPFMEDKSLILNDENKKKIIENIHSFRDIGEPIFKVIHFEKPINNCSYLRKERIFINSKGQVSFCHFLSPVKNSFMFSLKDKSIQDIIKMNNYVRNKFLEKKWNEIKAWKIERKTSSPCSYCLKCMGVKKEW